LRKASSLSWAKPPDFTRPAFAGGKLAASAA
jgi:hypothetical protein